MNPITENIIELWLNKFNSNMDTTITQYLNHTTDKNHYLPKANSISHKYFTDFLEVYETYKCNFAKELNSWLKDKMLLNNNTFNEKQFIQFACEATIVKFFADKFKSNLDIEKKIHPTNDKDVDLVFDNNGITFNIEIKCPEYGEKEKIDSTNSLKIQSVGRLENYHDTLKDLQALLEPVADKLGLDETVAAKNMDNNLKDFLKSAHDKFNPSAAHTELNVLSVSCNDAEDMQLWYYYMFWDKGLFTRNSFCPHSEYENVDVVLLNNLYFKHNKYYDKKLSNSWDFGNSFNILFINPFAKQKKDNAVCEFLKICPNLNRELVQWKMPGDAEETVKDSRRVVTFIKAELEENKGIYLFELP